MGFDPRSLDESRWCSEPFALEAHEYVPDSGWRIKVRALRDRLTTLDREWSTSVPEQGMLSAGGLQAIGGAQAVTVAGSMTLLGATRSGMASAPIIKRPQQPMVAQDLIKALAEAQDILLMALAQQWNIGAYCKDIPSEITTTEQLAVWLG